MPILGPNDFIPKYLLKGKKTYIHKKTCKRGLIATLVLIDNT